MHQRRFGRRKMTKNNITKPLGAGKPRKKKVQLSKKLARIVSYYATGGDVDNKPKPNNIINFPVKPGTPMDEWYKTAKKSDYLELLVGMAGFKEDALKDLSESELKDLLQYTIETGGFGI